VAVLQPDGELEQLQAVVGVSDADISSYPALALECVFKETLRMHLPGVADDPEVSLAWSQTRSGRTVGEARLEEGASGRVGERPLPRAASANG
jgi:hypothetical protein